jgi:hypothetical protein
MMMMMLGLNSPVLLGSARPLYRLIRGTASCPPVLLGSAGPLCRLIRGTASCPKPLRSVKGKAATVSKKHFVDYKEVYRYPYTHTVCHRSVRLWH